MFGIYYVIRHKATGELMPQMRRGKGYSWWNPSSDVKTDTLPITGTPRLLSSRRQALKCIVNWMAFQNGKTSYGTNSLTGEWEDDIYFKKDSRKKEDLEVIEVNLAPMLSEAVKL